MDAGSLTTRSTSFRSRLIFATVTTPRLTEILDARFMKAAPSKLRAKNLKLRAHNAREPAKETGRQCDWATRRKENVTVRQGDGARARKKGRRRLGVIVLNPELPETRPRSPRLQISPSPPRLFPSPRHPVCHLSPRLIWTWVECFMISVTAPKRLLNCERLWMPGRFSRERTTSLVERSFAPDSSRKRCPSCSRLSNNSAACLRKRISRSGSYCRGREIWGPRSTLIKSR